MTHDPARWRAPSAPACTLALALIGAATLPHPAAAGPAAEVAQRRIAAIASGDVASLAAGYGPGATLEWVGGPLDGGYRGQALAGVWTRFAMAQGPLQGRITDIVESANPRGQTVMASVVFSGRATVRVRYVLVLRDAQVVNEVWQIDPAMPG